MFIAEEKKNYPSRKKKSAGRNSDKCTKMEMNKIMGRRGKKERKKKKNPPPVDRNALPRNTQGACFDIYSKKSLFCVAVCILYLYLFLPP